LKNVPRKFLKIEIFEKGTDKFFKKLKDLKKMLLNFQKNWKL